MTTTKIWYIVRSTRLREYGAKMSLPLLKKLSKNVLNLLARAARPEPEVY